MLRATVLILLGLDLSLGMGVRMPAESTETYHPLSLPTMTAPPPRRREATPATCEQTYGNGSVACGGSDSDMCYNPTLGQTCCELDKGFCSGGSYCAPVAGYCCLQSEDLETCARNAGFDLPIPAVTGNTTSGATTSTTSTTLYATPTVSVSPSAATAHIATTEFLTETSLEIVTTSCDETPGITAIAIPTTIPTPTWNNTSLPPFVQVAAAGGKGREMLESVALMTTAMAMTAFLAIMRR
ncbi:hypothetical protein F5Y17DRAFT_277199 [Xylariaceae sp. FL0594]|nr:hypothetical protein F5Y17DRAFT_277199 [Xylariaceae sp. FL0594]